MSGATVVARPRPITSTTGSTAPTYDTPASMRVISRAPTATSSGPTVICRRGPIRAAIAPDRAESASIRIVIGKLAAPASIAE